MIQTRLIPSPSKRHNGLRILDLFSGLESVAKIARAHGHEVITLDINPKFGADLPMDILKFDPAIHLPPGWKPDIIWASPPCEGFSVAAFGHHWTGGKGAYIPRTEWAKTSILILNRTVSLINEMKPARWYMENPRGMMRKMESTQDFGIRHTVTYCQYGDDRMKPTDIWTNDSDWAPRPKCKNGMPCHESAPRGARSGTQGMKNAAERSTIPRELIEELLIQ